MHSFKGKSCVIHHNNDLHEHDVFITHPDAQRAIAIPLSDLLDFIGELVVNAKIAELEQQTGRQALGLKP